MIMNKTGNANVAAWSAPRAKFSDLLLAADGAEKPREFESNQVFGRQQHRSTALSDVVKFMQQTAKI